MRMVVLAVIAAVVFEVFVVVFAASADKTQVRNLPKWAWVLICIVIPVIGPLAYLVYGRPVSGASPYSAGNQSQSKPSGDSSGRAGEWLKNFLGLEHDDEDKPNVPPQFRYRDESTPRPRKGPVAPDDDPEFLRKLDEQLKRQSSGEAPGTGDGEAGEGDGGEGDGGSAEPGDDNKPNEPGTPQ